MPYADAAGVSQRSPATAGRNPALAEFERDLIRARGRPPVMSAEKLAVARSMYDSREHTTAKIAEVVGVSRATLYRHLGAGRSVDASVSDGG